MKIPKIFETTTLFAYFSLFSFGGIFSWCPFFRCFSFNAKSFARQKVFFPAFLAQHLDLRCLTVLLLTNLHSSLVCIWNTNFFELEVLRLESIWCCALSKEILFLDLHKFFEQICLDFKHNTKTKGTKIATDHRVNIFRAWRHKLPWKSGNSVTLDIFRVTIQIPLTQRTNPNAATGTGFQSYQKILHLPWQKDAKGILNQKSYRSCFLY